MVTSTVPTVTTPLPPAAPNAVRAGMLSILAWMGVFVGMGVLALGALGVVGFIVAQAVMDLV